MKIENQKSLEELVESRKVFSDKIADINWSFINRHEKVLEFNDQIAKIDILIEKLLKYTHDHSTDDEVDVNTPPCG